LLGLFLLSKMEKEFDSTSLMIGLVSSFLIVFYLKYLGIAWTWFIMISVIANFSLTNLVEKILKVSRQYSFNKQK